MLRRVSHLVVLLLACAVLTAAEPPNARKPVFTSSREPRVRSPRQKDDGVAAEVLRASARVPARRRTRPRP